MKLIRTLRSVGLGAVPISRTRAIAVSERLAAVSTLTSSLEHLVTPEKFGPGGVNDWDIVRHNTLGRGALTRRVLDSIGPERRTIALHYARVVVSVGILLPGRGRWRGVGNAFLGLSTVLSSPRHRYGSDGSDQIASISQTVAAVARLSGAAETQDAALWYGAMQASLAYAVPGWLKLLGPQWRGGSALSGIMRTRAYGHPRLYAVMRRYPRATKYLSHSMIVWECAFPLVYAAGGRLARPMLAVGFGFHVVNGFAMGLGRFLSAFPSMYPMLAYTTASRTHPVVAGRDDRAVRTTVAVIAAAGAVGGLLAARTRLEVLDGWATSKTMTTRHANRLQYKTVGAWQEDAPVVVLLPDRAETPEHFSWLIDRITELTGCGVLSYSRAGYGASQRCAAAPYALSESVDDLIDLIDAVVPAGRRVVLVGHAFGGHLARGAAAALADRLHAVVYLDHSHAPGDDVAEHADPVREVAGMRLITRSLRAGLGVLVTRPRWLEDLPYLNQRQVYAQWSDARLWRAAAREFAVLQAEYGVTDRPVHGVAGHAMVISAQQSVDQWSDRIARDHELVENHRRAGYHAEAAVIAHADQQGLLTNQRYAVRVADRIIGFVAAMDRPIAQRAVRNGSGPNMFALSDTRDGGTQR